MSLGAKLPTVLQLYLDDTRTHLINIERILSFQNNLEQIILAAHSIRAASAHMGVTPMVDAANALEAAAQESTKGEAQENLLFLLMQIKKIFEKTEQLLQGQSEAELAL